jgi:hypothetical protein
MERKNENAIDKSINSADIFGLWRIGRYFGGMLFAQAASHSSYKLDGCP